MTQVTSTVRAGEEQISLPTYPAYEADPNPMFLEKRVYQGSSGKVYPNPFTDRISTEKSDRTYRSIYLENEYVRLTILPEIGGRIFTGEDKTNGYDFFYRQNVIKPALVGLLGPWISGGVEFNWPQHHRPSTFMPVHATIERGEDGSATVWLSEHDPMLRMKGMVGICLYPGRSVVEAKVRLYNRTPFVQTFLWWANVAVHVHEQYQAFFPPDVSYIADHAKRAVSHFPIARNFYYGVDYTDGVDLRWYKNIPVPTSYMVTQSNYDFAGGYDHDRQAGFVHVADRHIAPGKKLWTWGSGEFGKAWDRNLTDSDGPYVELMAGVYTDNQPDFSWTHPYETKTFSQFWYPIQKIGPVACANVHAALSLGTDSEHIRLGVCATESLPNSSIEVMRGKEKIFSAATNLMPGEPWTDSFECKHKLNELHFELRDANGNLVLEYQPKEVSISELPESATEPLPPAEIESVDELYITGLHLEQYRHATRSPESYWEEGLRRDPGDVRINQSMGLLALRSGEFVRAENFFRAAIARLTLRNPNPRDGEAYYNLGLTLSYQDRVQEAYSAFYKATWSYNWRGASHFELAKIFCQQRNFVKSLQHVEECLKTDSENLKARDMQAALLRLMNQKEQARRVLDETLRLDPLDFLAHAERPFLDSTHTDDAIRELGEDIQTALDIAYDYASWGLLKEAMEWLQAVSSGMSTQYPMVFYTMAWLADRLGEDKSAEEYRKRASDAPSLYCFPARLEEMVVLQEALRHDPKDAKASYYLGNFYYDRKRYDEAIVCWRDSVMTDPTFSIPWRNLGIAEYNVRHDPEAALAAYSKAFEVNPDDARLLYEFDQLKKRLNFTPAERLAALEARNDLVEYRDDLAIEVITQLNITSQYERAMRLLLNRRFNPWEGGEGLVSGQYVATHTALGREAIETGNFARAALHFQEARKYPENLGEGKHLLTLERQLDYWEGLALEQAGDKQRAQEFYLAAAAPLQTHSVHSFYRALALRKLGREEEAQTALKELKAYAQPRGNEEPKIDYFATSLPNFLLFEDDLRKRNHVDCLALEAYAELGLGKLARAQELFLEVARLDSSNSAALEEIPRLQESKKKRVQTGA
jgi:tetratricopeptide (TPR) repeat protein